MVLDNLIRKKKIHLSDGSLHDDDLDVLVEEVLQKSTVLKELHLYSNEITLVDGKFTESLSNNRTVRILVLRSNNIGAEGAKHLANALKVNQSLQRIGLRNNRIGDEGAKSLADALMVNKSLQTMGLSQNNIGAEGVKHLGKRSKSTNPFKRYGYTTMRLATREPKAWPML